MKKKHFLWMMAVAFMAVAIASCGSKSSKSSDDEEDEEEQTEKEEETAKLEMGQGDLAAFSLVGPVKEMTQTSYGFDAVYKFDKKGHFTVFDNSPINQFFSAGITRNDDSRIVKGMMNIDEERMEWKYDELGRPTFVGNYYMDGSDETNYLYKDDSLFPYAADGNSYEIGVDDPSWHVDYEYLEFDEHGNWTQRNVTVDGETSLQTRSFVYYE